MQILNYREMVEKRLTDLFRHDPAYLAFVYALADVLQEKQEFLANFQNVMLNIDLSTGANLDLIGNLVGQPRELLAIDDNPYFGFDGAENAQTFGTLADPNVGGFFRSILDNPVSSRLRKVDDVVYRKLIKARIIKNKSSGTINDLLQVVNILDDSNSAKVEVGAESGTANLILTAPVSELLKYELGRLSKVDNIIPMPLGVRLKVVEV